jgi:predicted MPP superfamily phosphohydrolase
MQAHMLSRRHLLRASAAAAASGLGLGVYTWQVEPHWLEVTRRVLPIAGLPSALEGRTLAQLSDIHVGSRVADSYVARTFERVRALAPDVVAYTGDFTSYHENIYAHAERLYRDAPRGRLGTLGIFGNHDYGPNWAHPEVAARLAGVLGAQGIQILRNEVADVAGLQIAGMDDLWAERFDPARTLAALERTRSALVLSHNPDTVDRPGWDTFEGWNLAGHTHGGQCKPPFLPPPLLPVQNRRYTSGHFDLSGHRRMYISRGVGHLTQVRFNVRPEVALFELRRV